MGSNNREQRYDNLENYLRPDGTPSMELVRFLMRKLIQEMQEHRQTIQELLDERENHADFLRNLLNNNETNGETVVDVNSENNGDNGDGDRDASA